MESNNDPDNDSRLYKPSLAENLSNFDNLHNLCEIRIQSIHMLLEIKFQIKKQSFFSFFHPDFRFLLQTLYIL